MDSENFTDPTKQKDFFKNVSDEAAKNYLSSLEVIEKTAQSVDAVRLFVAIIAQTAFGPVDLLNETTHGSVPVKLELLAYHIYPFFGDSNETPITPWHTGDCIAALDKLFIARTQQRSFYRMAEAKINSFTMLAHSLQIRAEIVRGSAYPEQTTDEINSIQGRFESWFVQRHGIGPKRAQEILWAIMKTQETIFNSFIKDVRNYGKKSGDFWEQAKKKSPNNRTEAEQNILKICEDKKTASVFGFVEGLNKVAPTTIPVSHTTLKHIDKCPSEEEWQALRDLIGLTVENRKHMTDPFEVRKRPLFVLPDNSVVLADLSNALDALWDKFESFAKDDKSFYDKQYQKAKAEWLENKVALCLSKIFPVPHIYSKLSYPDPDKTDGSTTELDVAVLWGPFLILVEAKAKQFRIESQIGDIGRLRTDIKANVDDAFQQAKRALRYITQIDKPEFIEISSKRQLSLQKNKILRTYLLTISQHHLAGIVNELSAFRDLGLFKDGEYPFSMCIADLEIISEFCYSPEIFLHYIEKRLELQKEDVFFHADEIDFFGAYLGCRLQAERLYKKDSESVNFVWLSGFSEKFDEWMEYKRGTLETLPSIKLEIPEEIEDILAELRRRADDDHARWIAFSLLAMTDRSLNAIAQLIKELKRAKLTPGMFRRAVHQEGDTVISIVASLDLPASMLRERTAMRAVLEKYRRKSTKSIGIGIMVADKSKPFDCAAWFEGPWEYDEKIEKALNSEPAFVLATGQKLPGRNERCVCGSSKKFKKCCLPKFEKGTD